MQVQKNLFTRGDFYTLIVILALAAILRFVYLETTEYHFDEALLVSMAQDLISGEHFPTEGLPASMGFPAPPTMVFLVAIPYLLTSDPLAVEITVVILNLIGIALFYLIVQRYFSSTTALIASLVFVCNPWSIQFSREIWPPDLLTPFVLAAIWFGLLGFVEGRFFAQVLCLPMLFIAASMHYGVVALLTIPAWFLWRKRASWRAVTLSIAIVLLMLIPFFAGFSTEMFERFRRPVEKQGASRTFTGEPFTILLHFASGAGVESMFEINDLSVYTDQVPVVFWVIAGLPVLIGVVIIRAHPLAPLVYLWAFSSMIALLILPINPHPHYMVTAIPALALLSGISLTVLSQNYPVLLPVWSVVLVIQCVLWFRLVDYVRTNNTPDFGPPLGYLLPIRTALTNSQDLVVVGGATGLSGYDIWSTMLFRETTCVRELIIADGGIAVLPSHSFSLLRAPNATPYEFANLYQSAEEIVFPLREGEGSYTLDQIEILPQWDEPELIPISPVHFDNSVILNGYRFSNGRLYLDWALTQQGTQDYKYFIHLLDENGERIAQRDPSFYAGKYWCAGDRIVTWAEMELPPATTTLRIGMYRYEGRNIFGSNVIDEAGNATPWADIALSSAD